MTPSTPSPASTELSRAAGDPHPAAPEAAGERELGGAGPAGGWVTASPPKGVEIAQAIVRFPVLVARHKDLILTGVQRELRAQFTGTLLGWGWPLVQPLFMFAVYFVIFTQLLGMKFPELPEELKAAMGVYMFVGIAVWAGFGDSLTRGTTAIVANGNLIKKLSFPAESLPLNVVLVSMVTMLFALGAFELVVAGSHAVGYPLWPWPDPLDLLWIPVLLLLQALFTYGLALFLSTLYVFLRDTAQIMTVAITVWMFATPIFWVGDQRVMPDLAGWIVPYIPWNPMYHIVYAWRAVLMGGEPALLYEAPISDSVATFSVWAVASFVVGYAFFTLSQRRFADEV
jgi:ABC-type polysaccharide/polyol phosphate export permease